MSPRATPLRARHRGGGACGFTLVELLVAISVLALIAALSWRGVDGMMRTRDALGARSDQLQTLQTALAQWGADLDAMQTLPGQTAIDWNGQVLRIVRRAPGNSAEGLRVVAWSSRNTDGEMRWLRWQSAPVTGRAALAAAWEQAAQWAQSPVAELRQRETPVAQMTAWRIYFFRDNAWTNPMSSGVTQGVPGGATAAEPPQGVRLELELPAGAPVAGLLTRDWVRPTVSGGKS
jgi:general secretion pathway protein J